MNSRAIVSDLPLGPGDVRQDLLYARLLLHYLADRVFSAELANGARVLDASDFSAWCRELAEEARKLAQLPEQQLAGRAPRLGQELTPPAQRRYREHTCPDCDHEHEGREECGKYLGEGRFCHCMSKVPA